MESLLVSTGVVALAEIGDKTQLLALLLCARFRAPLPILAGILIATVANHALAALLGTAVGDWLQSEALQWGLGAGFVLMGLWTLKPDRLDGDSAGPADRYGAFLTTLVAFFLVEIGDKTQVATMALAARFQDIAMVTVGTTLGMMAANAPVVALGGFAADRLPLRTIRLAAAALFGALGALVCLEAAGVALF
ncbi:MAG: TMEM165/GDT1 family protein [Alphaproteobacteria bacterium]